MHDHAGTVIGGSHDSSGPHAPRSMRPESTGSSPRMSSKTISGAAQSRPTIITRRAAGMRGMLSTRGRIAGRWPGPADRPGSAGRPPTIGSRMAKSAAHRDTAVVVEVGWVNGLGAIRALGRRGVRVLAVDHRPYAIGFKSRYANRVLAPEPVADEEGFVRAMAELGAALDDPTPVFATHDEHLNALARNQADLPPALRLACPDWATLERIQRKRHQLDQAIACGVPVPETRHPRSAGEALAAARELGFPVLLKPSD